MNWPRCLVTRNCGPSRAWAAVAPSATITSGLITAISASSQGRQADLHRIRFFVNAALAPRLPFEVFDHVGDVGLLAIDAGFFKRIVEQLTRRTNERFAGQIFFVAGLFADKHDVCTAGAFAENGLRSLFPKVAGLAIGSYGFE